MRLAVAFALAGSVLAAGCSNPFVPIVAQRNDSQGAANSSANADNDRTRAEDRAFAGRAGGDAPVEAGGDGGKPGMEPAGGGIGGMGGTDTGKPGETGHITASVNTGDGGNGGSSGVQVSEEWFAGRWSDSSDCRDPIDFRSNGTFVLPGGERGNWSLSGDTLTLDGRNGHRRMRLTPLGDDRVRNDRGATSYRCD